MHSSVLAVPANWAIFGWNFSSNEPAGLPAILLNIYMFDGFGHSFLESMIKGLRNWVRIILRFLLSFEHLKGMGLSGFRKGDFFFFHH